MKKRTYCVKCFRANDEGDLELWLEMYFEFLHEVLNFVGYHEMNDDFNSYTIYKIL